MAAKTQQKLGRLTKLQILQKIICQLGQALGLTTSKRPHHAATLDCRCLYQRKAAVALHVQVLEHSLPSDLLLASLLHMKTAADCIEHCLCECICVYHSVVNNIQLHCFLQPKRLESAKTLTSEHVWGTKGRSSGREGEVVRSRRGF